MLAPVRAYLDHATFGQLPRGGGTFDQDADLMDEMRLVARIVGEEEAKKAKKAARRSRPSGGR